MGKVAEKEDLEVSGDELLLYCGSGWKMFAERAESKEVGDGDEEDDVCILVQGNSCGDWEGARGDVVWSPRAVGFQ